MRRQWIWFGIMVLMLAAGFGGFMSGTSQGSEPPLPACPDGPAIVLDPGHGGIDGGANVPGLLEKEIVLDVALRTKTHLDRYHIPVVMTRMEDNDLGGDYDGGRLRRDLYYRFKVANNCQTVLMVSLHVNSTRNPAQRGMMVFYQPSRASRDAAYLFDDILRRRELHGRRELPIPRGDFAVLRATKAPALLLEMGFITNAEDRQLLADSAYREKVAQALADACSAIYHQWAKNGNG